LRHRTNSKLGPTRNTAFAYASAPYILCLDADNLLEPTCVENCLEVIKATGAAAAYPLIQQFGDSDGLMGGLPWEAARFRFGNYIDAMALIRKSAWSAVGGYGIRNGWEDYDLWLKFIARGLWAAPVPKVLARYRVHNRSMLRMETETLHVNLSLRDTMRRDHPWLEL
jgi:glycosyltransferase involved in cell wall biosynthesis